MFAIPMPAGAIHICKCGSLQASWSTALTGLNIIHQGSRTMSLNGRQKAHVHMTMAAAPPSAPRTA